MRAAVPMSAAHEAGHLMRVPRPSVVRAYWAITTGVLVLAIWMAVFYAPVHGEMGLAQ